MGVGGHALCCTFGTLTPLGVTLSLLRNTNNFLAKFFLVEFTGFICGLKAITHTSCSLCAKLGKWTDFNAAKI